jgi:hypothetical protein
MITADSGTPGPPDMPGRCGAPAADVTTLGSSIAASPIVVLAASGRPVPPCAVAPDRQTPAVSPIASPIASWAQRQASGDVDAEVLRWIASHVKGKKRLGLA